MAYEMVMPYHLHMPSYFLETFTEYPKIGERGRHLLRVVRVLKNSCPVLLFHNGHFIYQVFRSCKLINNK